MNKMPDPASGRRRRWKERLWLAGLWLAGVASVALVAQVIRLAMEAIGLRSH
ncbi:DUF2474 family protein [Cupriavidus sp. 30B13]|uniref:DUF2474 family protein n=1 Tax=Cupriavidus sp. 30B13 TaxID=3384241 RepID=UPI003B8FC75C